MSDPTTTYQHNNNKIAKNTILLYFRMILTMGVSLYTVRVVFNILGVVDYGIYNVVGGIVTMFSFLSGSMATASLRFFAFELGRKNYDQLKKTFSMTMTIYVLIGIVILILAETVGLWFLNNKMTIPVERMEAANWIYQFAILSFMFTMFGIPYNAAIIAHERMNVYAYVSIIEIILKLAIVYVLVIFPLDKLKLYAVLTFLVTVVTTSIYQIYSRIEFHECKFQFYWNKSLFKEIITYSGWNLFGMIAGMFNDQGISILLNIFFGSVINASRSITYQINNSISQFARNFMVASQPQIIRYYAENNYSEMHELIFRSSKISYLLLLIVSLPIFVEIEYIIRIWLSEIPQYVILFTRLAILNMLIESLSYPLITAAQATGKIKLYQATIGTIIMFNLPICYIFLKLKYQPEVVFVLTIIISILCLLLRLLFLNKMINMSIFDFLKHVLKQVVIITFLSIIVPIFIYKSFNMCFLRLLLNCIFSTIFALNAIYHVGFSNNEKNKIKEVARNLKKFFHEY